MLTRLAHTAHIAAAVHTSIRTKEPHEERRKEEKVILSAIFSMQVAAVLQEETAWKRDYEQHMGEGAPPPPG